MAYRGVVYSGNLSTFNKAAATSLATLMPVLSQIDFALFGSFGLGAQQATYTAQLMAILMQTANISIGIANPMAAYAMSIASCTALIAQLMDALKRGVAPPTISIEVTTQLATLAGMATILTAQIAGLKALVQGGIAVKAPAINFAKLLSDMLATGPVHVVTFDDSAPGLSRLSSVGASFSANCSSGLVDPSDPSNVIHPTDFVYGVMIITKVPTVWAAMQAMLRTV